MMGDDTPDQSTVWSAPAEVQHILYREITRRMLAARGVTPALACGVGCAMCGVIDASPARCEQCTGVHTAGSRQHCRCGVDGCADSQCPGRTA
jgi:hypothetical protein